MGNLVEKLRAPVLCRPNWASRAPFWAVALAFGLIQTWANRFYMGNDGVSYLDMADAYLRGDWLTAINTSWNPLYSWLIALQFLVFRPSSFWEYPVVQLLNFGIYVVALASFDYCLKGLLPGKPGDDFAVLMIGYGLFVWSSLLLIGLWTVNADMLVAACLYATMGLLLRLHRVQGGATRRAVLLGVVLTVGYYSKAVMFPLGLAALCTAWFACGRRCALIGASTFGLLSMPLIVAISMSAGHLSIGETGRVNYAWYVNGVASRWWQGGGPASAGQPEHPPQILLNSPRIYAFGDAFPKETYPLWYDFSYWYRGLRVHLDVHRVANVMWTNIEWIAKLLARLGGGFLFGWVLCFLLYRDKSLIRTNFTATWPAWAVSVLAILLYSAVHIEGRYIGAPATVLFLTAYTAVRIQGKRLAAGIAVVAVGWAIVFASAPTIGARYSPWSTTPESVSWQAAEGLQKLGLRAHDSVASVCYSNRANVLWARLARVHIVAELDWNVNFWRLNALDQQRVLRALARNGASMAVSDEPPPDRARAGEWQQVGPTHYYAYSLRGLSGPLQSGGSSSAVVAYQGYQK